MVGIKLDEAALARLDGAAKAAALETVEAVKTDLVSSQTMPFDTGAMQGSLHTEQFDAADESHTVLQTDGPQARRLYFHPEYNFQRGKNPNAGAAWYGPYEAGGAKERFIPDTFAARMKEKIHRRISRETAGCAARVPGWSRTDPRRRVLCHGAGALGQEHAVRTGQS